MRRILLFAVAAAMLTVGIAGMAAAKQFVCQAVPCEGTKNPDQIGERNGQSQDIIRALGGDDSVNAARASKDADRVQGDGGDDFLDVGDGDIRDRVSGGPGEDTCVIDININNGTLNLDGLRDCENPMTPEEEGGLGARSAGTTDGLRPLTAEEEAAAEANYR